MNIFGGIMKCDVIANGVVAAVRRGRARPCRWWCASRARTSSSGREILAGSRPPHHHRRHRPGPTRRRRSVAAVERSGLDREQQPCPYSSDKDTRVILVQGFTGKTLAPSTASPVSIEYGTHMVAGGVNPRKARHRVHLGLPVFGNCRAGGARRHRAANATVLYVPPAFCGGRRSSRQSEAGIELVIVTITEGVPVPSTMVRVIGLALEGSSSRASIGPNCPGVITPGRVQDRHHARVHPQARDASGVISRSAAP